MNIIFELTASLLQLLIWEKFVYDFLGCKYSGKKAAFGFVVTLFIMLAEITVINYITLYDGLLSFALLLPW